MSKINQVYEGLISIEKKENRGITAAELSSYMDLDRANVSRYLNQLYKEDRVKKIDGRPVVYSAITTNKYNSLKNSPKLNINLDNKSNETIKTNNSLDMLVGSESSLQVPIQQAKAAILYPPRGLHTLILGETGVGKSMFAELMYEFSRESGVIEQKSPFVRFNCADYADNPQLVMSQIFGVKKGSYTGADSDKEGLLKKADGGIIFLDEIHRLSPQGQEMLFTYIDKGYFRPLGDTDKQIKVEAQIIAATTEDPQSFLLKTFTRRIPMCVTLPSLAERSVKERYYLLKQFIKAESKRLEKSIYFNKNALISFLLYDCPNNIGQLKSDIQLSCAKAFLNYKTKTKNFIIVEQGDSHQRVKKGLMKLQDYREEVNELLENMGDVLKFSYKDDDVDLIKNSIEGDLGKGEYFYDIIEDKIEKLKTKGLEEKEISQIINIDIESYFKKYIRDLPSKFRKDEISKIVDLETVELVEQILTFTSEKLSREFDEKVYFGLALHLQGSIERIRQGNKIYHPKLNFIRIQYADEFLVAMEVAKLIDSKFDIQVPLDEIGYLTMFLAARPYEYDTKKDGKVGVLVIMHGHSTASSMVEVANSLIGEECAEALDMPLSMKAEKMYETAKNKIKEMDQGKGVLLLVDMGSLTNFSEMIREELAVKIQTVDMVSTLLVIEAGRKAFNGRELDDIYKSCSEISRFGIQGVRETKTNKNNVIVTACFTGEGTAEKLKEMINQRMGNSFKAEVVALNILDKEDFVSKIEKLNKTNNVVAIVSAINLFVDNIPFIPVPDILTGDGITFLEKLV
ncbi:MAG: sigma-54-dependent transcriptional regulator, partial [Clostridium sp.]